MVLLSRGGCRAALLPENQAVLLQTSWRCVVTILLCVDRASNCGAKLARKEKVLWQSFFDAEAGVAVRYARLNPACCDFFD
jgi:hypothetical protein